MGVTLNMSRKGRTERGNLVIANLRAFMFDNKISNVYDLRVKHITDKGFTKTYNLPSRYVIDRTHTDNDLARTVQGWGFCKIDLEKSIKKVPLSKNDKEVTEPYK